MKKQILLGIVSFEKILCWFEDKQSQEKREQSDQELVG